MAEKLKSYINVPIWSFGIMVTIILAIFSWGIATASQGSAMRNQIQTNTIVLQELKLTDIRLQAEKADKTTIDDIKKSLDRIESKLDLHVVSK